MAEWRGQKDFSRKIDNSVSMHKILECSLHCVDNNNSTCGDDDGDGDGGSASDSDSDSDGYEDRYVR